MADLITTGLPGLDSLLGGGLRPGTCALLEGIPGVGKTTLGMQFVAAGAAIGESGIIVTFEQFPEQLYNDALGFGWDLRAYEEQNLVRVVCTSPEVFLDQLSDVGGMMDSMVADIGARRLVVDSVAHLGHVADNVQVLRPLVYGMLNGIRRAGLTAMITKEVESASPDIIPFEEYLVDTVIRLSYEMGDNHYRRRWIEVVKSRGQNHSHGRHAMIVGPRGAEVFPRHEPSRGEASLQPSPAAIIPIGVEGLDAMLGGGIVAGYSLLVAGSAGVGKTTLALQFIQAGARRGEPAVLVTFEESPGKLAQLAAGFNIDLQALETDGKLSVMHRSPLHLAMDQFIAELVEEVQRLGAQRVVIDSLTDLSMHVRDAMQVREAVFVLADALQQENVTSLFTTEVPELFGQTYVTSEHVSIIVDGIILMKYLEMESEIQRAISVLKMRGCDHDKGIRRYGIDHRGITISSRFEGTAGVMAGSPRQIPVTLSVRSFTEFDEALNNELLQRFSRLHPQAHPVSLSIPYNPDDARETVKAALEAPTTSLSVAPLCLYWLREFVEARRLLPLDNIEPEREVSMHMTDFLSPGMLDGRLYAVPAIAVCGVLLYRKDLLEEQGFTHPPRTWDELIEQARTIVEGHKDPNLIGYQFPAYKYEGLTTSFLQNLWSNGGDILEKERVALDSEPARQALHYMYDLIHRHELSPANLTTAAHGLEPQSDFLHGNTVFLTMLPSVAQACQRESSPLRNKVGIAPHPMGPMGTESITFLGGWHYGIPLAARAPETAANFIRFMTSYEVQRERTLRGGPLPTIGELYSDPEIVAFNPNLPLLKRLLDTARKRHEIPCYGQISALIQTYLHPVLLGEADPDEALAGLAEQVGFVLEQGKNVY